MMSECFDITLTDPLQKESIFQRVGAARENALVTILVLTTGTKVRTRLSKLDITVYFLQD